MYIWKCWRDTRSTFLIILSAVLAVGALVVYVAFDPFGWIAAKPLDKRALWQFTAEGLFGATLGVLPMAGFVLGALGVGTEFERRTAEFLLARPRTRSWFLWTSWGLGAAQMAALVVVSNLFRYALPGSSRFGAGSPGDFLVSLVAIWTVGLVYYSLTYLMTTLARRSGNGMALAVGVLTVYFTLFVTLRAFYNIDIPFFAELIDRTFDVEDAGGFMPATVPAWLAVCAAMTVGAQISFERAEI